MKDFLSKKWPYLVVIAYILFPIDILPDALPLLGSVDDSVLLLATLLKDYADTKKEKSNGV